MAEKFGRYEIQSEIGRGGMATVYKAYDPQFDREVAIKVLPLEFLHDPQFRERFKREARIVAALEHTAIVPVYDFGEENGQPFIVMRYMSGGSLADRLKQGPLPVAEAARIICRLGTALDVAHARGIIHRDLKPGNILFDQYNEPFISDFGIARLAQEGIATITGNAIIGTPAYMSPEQVQGDKKIDGRSDIYALGIIAYEMLTGKMPYNADTPAKIMMMHILEPVPQLSVQTTGVPQEMNTILEKALAKDPNQRYATGQDLVRSLEAVTQHLAGEYRTKLRSQAEALMARMEFDQAIVQIEQARSLVGSSENDTLLAECRRRKEILNKVRSLTAQHDQAESQIREIIAAEPWLPPDEASKTIILPAAAQPAAGLPPAILPKATQPAVHAARPAGRTAAPPQAAPASVFFVVLEAIFLMLALAAVFASIALSQYDVYPTVYLVGLVVLACTAFSRHLWGKSTAGIVFAVMITIAATYIGMQAGAEELLEEYYAVVLLPYALAGLFTLAIAGLAFRELRSKAAQ